MHTKRYKLYVLYSIIHCGFSALSLGFCAGLGDSLGPKVMERERERKNHERGLTFVTFCLIWGKKKTATQTHVLNRTRSYTGRPRQIFHVLHIKREPESALLSGDDGVMHCFSQKDSLFNYKSALLAENVERANEWALQRVTHRQSERETETQWMRCYVGWKTNKCTLTRYDMFLQKGVVNLLRSFVCFYKLLLCVFQRIALLKFENVYGFHGLPPNDSCFSTSFFCSHSLSFPLAEAVFARLFHENL